MPNFFRRYVAAASRAIGTPPLRLTSERYSAEDGALSAQLSRDEVEALVVDGFFPQGAADELPRRERAAGGLLAFGLPYASDPAVRKRLHSVGKPIGSIELEIRGADGRPVAQGEVGDVFVRGGQVSGEYEGVGSLRDDGGWFATRDRGYLDAYGFLYLDGRADDVIVRGGENISPGEIEDVLRLHPAVADAAAVAIAASRNMAGMRRTGSAR